MKNKNTLEMGMDAIDTVENALDTVSQKPQPKESKAVNENELIRATICIPRRVLNKLRQEAFERKTKKNERVSVSSLITEKCS